MDWYSLSRRWFDFCFENTDRINTTHTAIFMFIIEQWNRFWQKEKFWLPAIYTMEALWIKSKTTYYNAFNDLIEFWFIEIIEKSKNQNTANIIKIAISKNESAHMSALDSANVQQVDSTYVSGGNIDKQVNKETNKQYKTKDDKTKEEVKEELQKFIEHWNKIFLEKREVTNKLEEKYLQIRKEYTKDDFKKWYNLYKDTKLKVKKEKWEFMFLLSPLAFLTNQVNWFISYL